MKQWLTRAGGIVALPFFPLVVVIDLGICAHLGRRETVAGSAYYCWTTWLETFWSPNHG